MDISYDRYLVLGTGESLSKSYCLKNALGVGLAWCDENHLTCRAVRFLFLVLDIPRVVASKPRR